MAEGHGELSPKLKKLSAAGISVDTLSKDQQAQVAVKLDDEEIEALSKIKKKLDSGLPGRQAEMREGNIGGFIW